MEVICVEKDGKIYNFSDVVSENFLLEFMEDNDRGKKLRDNYKVVAKIFSINNFFVANDGILSDYFIKNFKYGDSFILDEVNGVVFDSAVSTSEKLDSRDEECVVILQNALVYVNEKYGEEGLKKLRKMGLAQAIYNNRDKFDLVAFSGNLYSIEKIIDDFFRVYEFFLNYRLKTFDGVDLTLEFMMSIFSNPYLLYRRNGICINDKMFENLYLVIDEKLDKHNCIKKMGSYYNSRVYSVINHICEEICNKYRGSNPISPCEFKIGNKIYRFDSNEVSEWDIQRFKSNKNFQDRYNIYKIFGKNERKFIICSRQFLFSDNLFKSLGLDSFSKSSGDKRKLLDDYNLYLMFNCIDGSRVDMKKIQRALSYASIKLSKLGIQKLKGFCFATTITNDSIDIFIDDPNDEYDLDVDGNGNKFIHLDMSKYSMEIRIDDLFKHLNKTFLDWPNENAKSALFGMPQLLYDENGKLLDEISIGKLLVRITEAISDETGDVSKLAPGLFVKAMEVCKEIYLENNLYRYKKSNISNKYLVKRSK